MCAHVLVWDIETVPDLRGFAAANGLDGKGDDEIRSAIGDKFPKHIYHSIICIGALIYPLGATAVVAIARRFAEAVEGLLDPMEIGLTGSHRARKVSQ
jgi:hypothetical protein